LRFAQDNLHADTERLQYRCGFVQIVQCGGFQVVKQIPGLRIHRRRGRAGRFLGLLLSLEGGHLHQGFEWRLSLFDGSLEAFRAEAVAQTDRIGEWPATGSAAHYLISILVPD
jgi:hypothetical protein